MKTSQKGIDLIKEFEGCRLKAYKDAVGVPTIGYGHTKGVKMGDTITQAQAEELLKDDLASYEKKVDKYNDTYHFNQNQFDALVSFAYNIGNIDQLTNKGKRTIAEISEKIPAYNKAGGKVLAGLTRRRKAEKALFDTIPDEAVNTATAEEKAENGADSGYVVGRTYTICASDSLNVRRGPGVKYALVGYNNLTADAKRHATANGALRSGTRVTCKDVKIEGNNVWMKIPSGWICAIYGKYIYVK